MEILFEDKNFVAINKPAGLSVHNVEDPENVLSVLQKQLSHPKLLPIHRLDKETSGVLLVAKSSEAAARMADLLNSDESQKIYRAVLKGSVKGPAEEWQEWTWALTDKAEGRKNPLGEKYNRKDAKTLWRCLRTNKYFSEVELRLETGRQHQIRKHAALAGHPVVGDPRYNEPKYNKMIESKYSFVRMALHCERIKLAGFDAFIAEAPTEFGQLFALASAN